MLSGRESAEKANATIREIRSDSVGIILLEVLFPGIGRAD
jgi:hypothetical protein